MTERSLFCFCRICDRSGIKAIDSVGDPPLPILNREVKPDSADGTANVCGRVGHRHFYKKGHSYECPFLVYISVSALKGAQ